MSQYFHNTKISHLNSKYFAVSENTLRIEMPNKAASLFPHLGFSNKTQLPTITYLPSMPSMSDEDLLQPYM